MASKNEYEEARALLEKAAEGDDANARAAKRALAALDQGEPDGDEDKPDGAGAEDKTDDASAEGDAPSHDEPDGDEPKAEAAYRLALKAAAETHKLRAELAKRDAADERAKLIDSRPDLAPEMVAVLRKAPMALVRETIASLPKAPNARAERVDAPTRGAGQGDGEAARLSPSEKRALDERMGLVAARQGVQNTDYRLTLGVSHDAE